jgi:hypothetical protein
MATLLGLTLTKDSEMVQQALYFIAYSHSIKVTPQMMMTCAVEDTECDHPVCFIYGAENWMTTEYGVVAPMTPSVVPWQVGAWLIQEGIACHETETMRYGCRVKWYALAVHVRK